MKKLIVIAIVLAVVSIFAQDLSNIYLKNGDMIKGKVIATLTIPEPTIRVEMYGSGSIITIKHEDVLRIEVIPVAKTGSFGLGFGIPYGVIGVNCEFNLSNNFSVNGGIGTTVNAGIGYCVGTNLYFRGIENTWRPRISLMFGTNGLVEYWTGDFDVKYESYPGINIGFGQKWMWGKYKRHGLDLDLIYIATSGAFDRVDELEKNYGEDDVSSDEEWLRFKISIGYRYGF